jgi:esterase/lipase superfamily enzyme
VKPILSSICILLIFSNLGSCKSDSELIISRGIPLNDKKNKILYTPVHDKFGNETTFSKSYYEKLKEESKVYSDFEIINESNPDVAKLASQKDDNYLIKKYNPDYLIKPDESKINILDNSNNSIKSIGSIIKEEDLKLSSEKLIYFGTNRNIENDSNINNYFGTNRSEKITYGYCKVNIPGYKYRERGDLPTPYIILNREIYKNEKRHFYLKNTPTVLSDTAFLAQLNDEISKNPNKKKVLIFLNGFNVSFDDAALRTAQLTHDLQFEGTSIFYSWPSKAKTLSYLVDENESKNSQRDIEEFLTKIYSNRKFSEIYLIAHSLGTRIISEIIDSNSKKIPNFAAKTRLLVLAAPDIDSVYFRKTIAPSFAALRTNITVYINENDKALSLSENIKEGKRVGSTPAGDNIYPLIETIDATGTGDDFLDHSYFSQSYKLLNDLSYLLKGHKAEKRYLMEINSANGKYWKIN